MHEMISPADAVSTSVPAYASAPAHGAPQILIPSTQFVSLDLYRNLPNTGARMMVFQDEDGHLYPRDDEFELIPGLTPGFTTNGIDFEPAGDPIRKVGSVLTVPTLETDVLGNPLGIATSGIEGGFEDPFNRTGLPMRQAVAQRNARVDDGQSAAQLL